MSPNALFDGDSVLVIVVVYVIASVELVFFTATEVVAVEPGPASVFDRPVSAALATSFAVMLTVPADADPVIVADVLHSA